jgi:hypothetical protein
MPKKMCATPDSSPQHNASSITKLQGTDALALYAQLLRDKSGAKLLDTSLQEEGRTDKKLTKLARSAVNLRAKKQKKKSKDQGGGVISRIVRKMKGR